MIFLIWATSHNILFLLLYSINFVSVNFYYKLILINIFIKHNQLNNPYYTIKYLNLYLFFNFCNFNFIYRKFFFLSNYFSLII
jgi:hypothetical protein